MTDSFVDKAYCFVLIINIFTLRVVLMRILLIYSNILSFFVIHIELGLKLTDLFINILHRNNNMLIVKIGGFFCIKC